MGNKYLMCMDGGGSKTEFSVRNISNNKTYSFVYASSNYKTIGIEKAGQNIVQSFNDVCEKLTICLNQIECIVFGISGCDTPSDYQVYQTIIEQIKIPKEKMRLYNDSELIFRSMAQAPGICTVCGTGSIAIGFDENGSTVRCGGWGSPLSDEGSGYWIGSQILKHLIKYLDGCEAFYDVYSKILDYLNLEMSEELPSLIASLSITEVASVASIVCIEAQDGSAFCKQIIKQAATHVGILSACLYKKLNFSASPQINIVMTGSIFKDTIFIKEFRSKVTTLCGNSNITFTETNVAPAVIGLNLAKQIYSHCK